MKFLAGLDLSSFKQIALKINLRIFNFTNIDNRQIIINGKKPKGIPFKRTHYLLKELQK